MSGVNLMLGDCLDVLRGMADNSVDSIVTDPPAGIAFMGKDWDKDKGGRAGWVAWMTEVAGECLRVIKPGGHALVWAIPRTSHWTGTAWEMAGWQPRDKIYHVFGSGFPKSLDVSKAIDKAAGARGHDAVGFNVAGIGKSNGGSKFRSDHPDCVKPGAITEAAQQWQGWGTALKPAVEEWWLMRKPLIGAVAANVMAHGTGALNIMACRVPTSRDDSRSSHANSTSGTSSLREVSQIIRTEGTCNPPSLDVLRERHSDLPSSDPQRETLHQQSQGFPGDCHPSLHSCGEHAHDSPIRAQEFELQQSGGPEPLDLHATGSDNPLNQSTYTTPNNVKHSVQCSTNTGRWPANLILQDSDEVRAGFPAKAGASAPVKGTEESASAKNAYGGRGRVPGAFHGDAGSAARFFKQVSPEADDFEAARFMYCAKASKRDRDEGLEGFEQVKVQTKSGGGAPNQGRAASSNGGIRANIHPTVKPTNLMAYLCRLVTPPGGVVLDPFMGSGSTGKAAKLEGFGFIGIEREAAYIDIARARIDAAAAQAGLFAEAANV